MIHIIRVCVLILLAIITAGSVPGAAAPRHRQKHRKQAAKPAVHDAITTCAVFRDAGTSRIVPLKHFRPIQYLTGKSRKLPEMNSRIVKLLLSYPRDGCHGYWWPRGAEAGNAYDGCTTDILLNGQLVMRGEQKGRTYCCGLTLEVFYRAIEGKKPAHYTWTSETAELFKRLWFCRVRYSPGPEEALLAYGMGRRIASPDKALPGDFVQIWRCDKTGHSVIFLSWARDAAGKIQAMHYWSTQPGTKGIGFTAELAGKSGNMIDPQKTSITRLEPSTRWKKGNPDDYLNRQTVDPGGP
ncbi:MAG: hypothetical protein WCK47_12615 [bacterium]